ncbi:MAG: CpXC domain-containing protein [Eubacteriales bacterium]|nr:CpXC domain-containing protein [Eubacteriales bacterium]
MANVVVKKIPCPKCSETTEAKLYMSINATNEPTLRGDVLDERLFKFRCTACGYEARLTYPVLYNDMKNRFMVYLIPEVDRFQLEDVELEQKYERLMGVRKRIVPDFNCFKEKVFVFESGLDDMAVEITKLVISEMVAKKHDIPHVEEGYLSMYDREKNTMGFTFFVGKDHEPFVQSARLEIYGKAVQIVSEMAIKDRKLPGFLKIDREWAQNVLYRYKRMKQLS